MPTPEEVAAFKRAFKIKAEQANRKIRWDEPTGFWAKAKTQTSLAPIVDALDTLQAHPTEQNLHNVLAEIARVKSDRAVLYKDALNDLTQSLLDALEEEDEERSDDLTEEDSEEGSDDGTSSTEDSTTTEDDTTTTDDEVTEDNPDDLEVEEERIVLTDSLIDEALALNEEDDELSVSEEDSEIGESFEEQMERFALDNGLEGEEREVIWEAWNSHLDDLDAPEIEDLVEKYETADRPPRDLDERVVLFAGELGLGDRDRYWQDARFWREYLRHTRFDIEFDDDTDEADEALRSAKFDPEAVPETSVMDQLLASMPKWKHDRNIVLEGDKMTMSFQKSIKETAVGGVEYWTGQIPGVEDGESMTNVRVTDLPEQDQAMISVAKDAIGKIRSKLTKGPFNNYGGLPEEVIQQQRIPVDILEHHGRQELAGEPAPAWWNAVVDVAALKAMNQVKGDNSDVNEHKLQMACLARATQEVGGGVCSKMAMATTGELTTTLPPGSEIVQLFHDFDHEFVIARVPGGNWFAVDPWPHEPTVLPFVDCQFNPKGVKNFVITKVTEKAAHPFGIDLDGVNWKSTIKEAMKETKIDALEMKGVYGHKGNKDSGNYDPALNASTNWG